MSPGPRPPLDQVPKISCELALMFADQDERVNATWPAYEAALKAAKFNGYLTLEREVGDDPRKDITMAIGFLKKHLGA